MSKKRKIYNLAYDSNSPYKDEIYKAGVESVARVLKQIDDKYRCPNCGFINIPED